ncbi:MAG: esterase/lipase family protein [Nocardioides sp.]
MPSVGEFLLPEGFSAPRVGAVLRETRVVAEAGRFAVDAWNRRAGQRHTPYTRRGGRRTDDPVVLVPGFLAGDGMLTMMAATLRQQGFRTYRSHIHVNVGCTLEAATQLERRIEWVAARRGARVQIVGHSLGGMLARGLAVRRPDLVAGIVTLGSPMLAPGAHHVSLARSVGALVRLNRAGVGRLMSEDCVKGACARKSFEESRLPLAPGVEFTAVYSRRDGIVDWRACVDPIAVPVEVRSSHLGMALDPQVIREVVTALGRHHDSALEVDR